jgi:hypothetical protein
MSSSLPDLSLPTVPLRYSNNPLRGQSVFGFYLHLFDGRSIVGARKKTFDNYFWDDTTGLLSCARQIKCSGRGLLLGKLVLVGCLTGFSARHIDLFLNWPVTQVDGHVLYECYAGTVL